MLGSFEVHPGDGILADVPGARLRALLIALALEPGRVVPKATLIDWIWGENPPADAANALQRLASRLRKVLPEGAIEGRSGGYLLAVGPDAVDALRFERLLAQARQEEGRPERVRLLREALGLWRGAAMQDVGLADSEAFDSAVTRLEGLRLTALEDRYEAEVGLGHGADVVAELTDAVTAQPLRERLVVALIRALVAAGRDSEALLTYERTREALADALGVDPSPELADLHVALLRGELGRREETRKTNVRAELTSFVGRDTDVAAVRKLIAGASADHPDRAGRLGQDQAGHGDRAHADRRPARRSLVGGARRHRRRRRPRAGHAHRARAAGCAARRGTERGPRRTR